MLIARQCAEVGWLLTAISRRFKVASIPSHMFLQGFAVLAQADPIAAYPSLLLMTRQGFAARGADQGKRPELAGYKLAIT